MNVLSLHVPMQMNLKKQNQKTLSKQVEEYVIIFT